MSHSKNHLSRRHFICNLRGAGSLAADAGSFSNSNFDSLFALSHPVAHINDFLSHDWQTGRWLKFGALSVYYNGPAAAVISVMASVTSALVELSFYKELPEVMPFQQTFPIAGEVYYCKATVLPVLVGFFVFVTITLSWQRLRKFALPWRHQQAVFLDKLCVHQADLDRKEEAIRGLAGFLEKSDQLVVLWSPTYFRRGWPGMGENEDAEE